MGGPAILFNPPADSYRVAADHYGSRFLFDGKGHFFWSMGERHDMQMSQNLASPLGKIHRLNDDGGPEGQSFRPYAWCAGQHLDLGHRNPKA
jgi:glucose/arabinose dehydrogenase